MVKQLKEGSGNARVKELFDRVNELDYWDDDTYREIWKIAAQTNKDPNFTELMNWYFDSLGKKFDAESGKWLGSKDDNYKSDIKKYDYIVYNFEKVMDRAARILGYYYDDDENAYVTKHQKYGKKKGTVKEDIDGIRYCVLIRSGSSRFYVLEQWCDSLQEAQDCARVLADLSSQDVDDDGESFDEYWAFDTKKWKAYLPADYYQDKYPFNYLFNPNIPIYRSDENGKAELLSDYVGRKVNDYTGRWKRESYKKNIRVNEKYRDYGYREITDERDLYYLDNIDDICKEQLPAYSRSLMIAAHNEDYDSIQQWLKSIIKVAHDLADICGDLEYWDFIWDERGKTSTKEHYSSSKDEY